MKAIIRNEIVNTMIFVAACGFALAGLTSNSNPVRAQESANAAVEPKVIEITAKKYEFSPSQIMLKEGRAGDPASD
jgi:hypothetical protein